MTTNPKPSKQGVFTPYQVFIIAMLAYTAVFDHIGFHGTFAVRCFADRKASY
jgi:hypothetical protein